MPINSTFTFWFKSDFFGLHLYYTALMKMAAILEQSILHYIKKLNIFNQIFCNYIFGYLDSKYFLTSSH